MNMIAPDPAMATTSGFSPARMDGRMNRAITRNDRPSATSAATPCQRPSTSTATAKSAASTSSGVPRWKSTSWKLAGSPAFPPL